MSRSAWKILMIDMENCSSQYFEWIKKDYMKCVGINLGIYGIGMRAQRDKTLKSWRQYENKEKELKCIWKETWIQ